LGGHLQVHAKKNECQWDDMGQAHAKIFRDPQEQAQQGAR
jgi:hypothetical protein